MQANGHHFGSMNQLPLDRGHLEEPLMKTRISMARDRFANMKAMLDTFEIRPHPNRDALLARSRTTPMSQSLRRPRPRRLVYWDGQDHPLMSMAFEGII